MSTAKRAYKKFYLEEKLGHNEVTYLLWDAIDTMTKGDFESEEQVEIVNKEIEKRLTWIIDRGVKQSRIEMVIAGISVVVIGVSGFCIGKKIKKIAKNKKLKILYLFGLNFPNRFLNVFEVYVPVSSNLNPLFIHTL